MPQARHHSSGSGGCFFARYRTCKIADQRTGDLLSEQMFARDKIHLSFFHGGPDQKRIPCACMIRNDDQRSLNRARIKILICIIEFSADIPVQYACQESVQLLMTDPQSIFILYFIHTIVALSSLFRLSGFMRKMTDYPSSSSYSFLSLSLKTLNITFSIPL